MSVILHLQQTKTTVGTEDRTFYIAIILNCKNT